MIHLEGGTCPSKCEDEDVLEAAYQYAEKDSFTTGTGQYPFRCPTCELEFRYMSGLLQHVESNACEAKISPDSVLGKFLDYFKPRVGREHAPPGSQRHAPSRPPTNAPSGPRQWHLLTPGDGHQRVMYTDYRGTFVMGHPSVLRKYLT